MVQVEEGCLGTLHEDVVAGVQFVVDECDSVGDVRGEARCTDVEVFGGDLVGVDRQAVEHPRQNLVGVFEDSAQLLAEDPWVEQVLGPQADPH